MEGRGGERIVVVSKKILKIDPDYLANSIVALSLNHISAGCRLRRIHAVIYLYVGTGDDAPNINDPRAQTAHPDKAKADREGIV